MHAQLNPWRQTPNQQTEAWVNYWDMGNLVVNLPTFFPSNGYPLLMLHSFCETTNSQRYPASIILQTERDGDIPNLFGSNYIEFWSNHHDSAFSWQTGLISSYTKELGPFDSLNNYFGGLKFSSSGGPSRAEAVAGPVDVMYIYDKKVGIWQDDPKEKLHVGGWIRSDSLRGLGLRTVFANDDGTLVLGGSSSCETPWCVGGNELSTDNGTEYLGTSNSFSLIMKTDGDERMRINHIGDVSIGRENWAGIYIPPVGKLDVNVGCWNLQSSKISFDVRGTYWGQRAKESSMALDSIAPSIRFYRPTGSDLRRSYNYWIELRDLYGEEKEDPGFSLDFLTSTSSTYMGEEEPTVKVRFLGNGNVGIGDDIIPTKKLDVDGQVRIRDLTGTGNKFVMADNDGVLHLGESSGTFWALQGNSISSGDFLGTTNEQDLIFKTNNSQRMKISSAGKVVIGTTTITSGNHTDYKLSVDGKIISKEVIVTLDNWSDYVFDDDYNLMPIEELENLIKRDKHLPEIPSAAEVQQNGVAIGDMQAKLLKKVEELTLYVIELKRENEELCKRINNIENK